MTKVLILSCRSQCGTPNISDRIATLPECSFGFGLSFGRMTVETETKPNPIFWSKLGRNRTETGVQSDSKKPDHNDQIWQVDRL